MSEAGKSGARSSIRAPASVLMLIDGFSVHAPGGARRVFLETARPLVRRGLRVNVVCRRLHPADPNELYGIRFFFYDDLEGNEWRRYRHYRAEIPRLVRQVIDKERPSLVIVHSASAMLGLDLADEFRGIRRLGYFHSPWNVEYDLLTERSAKRPWHPERHATAIFSGIRKHLDRDFLRSAGGVVVLSEYMRGELLAQHPELKEKPTAIIPGGVDPERFFPLLEPEGKLVLRRRLGVPEDALVMVAARNLAPRTGVDVLLQAFASARAAAPDLRRFLVLLCDGPRRGEYERLAESLGLGPEVLRFTGYVSEEDLPDWFRCADLSVMPTRALEGFGLATAEALACGTPVIGTDIGATPELLAKVDPALIAKGCQAESLAAKFAEFTDRGRLFELGRRAADMARAEWTWERHAQRMMAFSAGLKPDR